MTFVLQILPNAKDEQMIDFDAARGKIETYLNKSGVDLAISRSGSFSDGWYFFYQSKKYLESGDLSDLLLGMGPIIVDKFTEKFYALGSSNIGTNYIEEYIRQKNNSKIIFQEIY
ncbi:MULTISPECIES: YrhB domain-containing protein [Asaia]|uniref:YrhB domain-containing protein n=1 Tax=Asaia TaxID=91914 RepID=UPI002FC33D3F